MTNFALRAMVSLSVVLPGIVAAQAGSRESVPGGMMGEGMTMSGWLMAVCAVFGVLLLAALVLAILALMKYLRRDRPSPT